MYEIGYTYVYGGRFTSRGDWTHPARVIQTYELIVVTEGQFEMEIGEARYHLSAGDTLLIPPDLPHRGIGVRRERVSFYWLHFGAENEMLPPTCVHLHDPYAVTGLCRRLLHDVEEYGKGRVSDALLLVLLGEICKQVQRRDDPANALVARIREWIRINADRPITASRVAEQFGYHADYLSRLFKSTYGHGLKAEIDRVRMQNAKRLLQETDLTLSEIADRVGMEDYKLFLKFFQYHEGISPTDFRARYHTVHTNNR